MVKFGFREDKVLVIYNFHFANLKVWNYRLYFLDTQSVLSVKRKDAMKTGKNKDSINNLKVVNK